MRPSVGRLLLHPLAGYPFSRARIFAPQSSYGFILRRDLVVSPGMTAFMAAFREREAVFAKAEKGLAKRYLRLLKRVPAD